MTTQQTNDCASGKFKRLNYYHGMLLTEQDFQAEQYYFREKMKLHNRLLGYGVAWGLELKSRCTKVGVQSVNKIFIEPGFALDCEGNEIIVCHPYQVPIDEKINQLADSCKEITAETKLLIGIKYCECKSEPQPQYATECGDEDQQVQFSRIGEGFSVQVLLENEVPDCCKHKKQDECCENYKQDCPGLAVCCEEEHVIILGCINLITQEDKDSCAGVPPDIRTQNQVQECLKGKVNQLLASRDFHTKYINPCCKPPRVCKPCPTPQEKWERQKQFILNEVRKASVLIDLSGVIGKSVCDAINDLKKLDITIDKSNIVSISDIGLRQIEDANCYVAESETLSFTLVTDEQKQCVVFAYAYDRGV